LPAVARRGLFLEGNVPLLAWLLTLSRAIDRVNGAIGRAARWLVLVAVLVSAGNASVRYLLSTSSNAWLELQWYLFAAVFLFCAPYTHLRNEHVRIDVLVSRASPRLIAWMDILGGLLFLLPMALLVAALSWPVALNAVLSGEVSGDAGGLVRWPARLMIPLAFALLALQGVSEIIKRVAFLAGAAPDPTAAALALAADDRSGTLVS